MVESAESVVGTTGPVNGATPLISGAKITQEYSWNYDTFLVQIVVFRAKERKYITTLNNSQLRFELDGIPV